MRVAVVCVSRAPACECPDRRALSTARETAYQRSARGASADDLRRPASAPAFDDIMSPGDSSVVSVVNHIHIHRLIRLTSDAVHFHGLKLHLLSWSFTYSQEPRHYYARHPRFELHSTSLSLRTCNCGAALATR